MKQVTIKIHEIAKDGPPPATPGWGFPDELVGRVAFLWDGNIVTGWPRYDQGESDVWEADEDAGRRGLFFGVKHWVEFPVPIWDLTKEESK